MYPILFFSPFTKRNQYVLKRNKKNYIQKKKLMTIPKVQLVMLPLSNWKVARVIRFRFKHHLCDCGGTIVYTRPFTTTYNKNSLDKIDTCILEAIENLYTNVQVYSEDLIWNTSYSNIQTIYDGGRPKTNLTIRMTPSFDSALLPQFVGHTVYAYDVNLHIFLNYIGDAANIPPEIFITQGFPHNEDSFFQSNIQQIQTL